MKTLMTLTYSGNNPDTLFRSMNLGDTLVEQFSNVDVPNTKNGNVPTVKTKKAIVDSLRFLLSRMGYTVKDNTHKTGFTNTVYAKGKGFDYLEFQVDMNFNGFKLIARDGKQNLFILNEK